MWSTASFQLWGIALYPAINRRVIDRELAFEHHLFEISIAERIAKIPAHAQQNEVRLKVTPFEGMLVVVAHDEDLSHSFLPTVADQLCLCNTTRFDALCLEMPRCRAPPI